MPNGDSLNIGKLSFNDPSSITQGVLILPLPNQDSYFYIILMPAEDDPFENFGLEYSIVDMSLDGGLGDLTEKNVDIFTTGLYEKMQAVKHGNGRDWWLLTAAMYSDTVITFIKFMLTETGFEGPWMQDFIIPEAASGTGNMGQMKFSQDGSKLAYTHGTTIYLYDFDRCGGTLEDPVKIMHNDGSYGCEFSADARMLYISNTSGLFGDEGSVVQYCLSCPGMIEDSREIIYINVFDEHTLCQLQLGPDNKIYVPIMSSNYAAHLFTEVNQSISVINNPSLAGFACDFDTLTIPLVTETRCSGDLPNLPNYNLGPLIGSECDTIISSVTPIDKVQQIVLFPNPAQDYFVVRNVDGSGSNQLAIRSMKGEILFCTTNIQNNQKIEIDFLPEGIYVVEIQNENGKRDLSKLIVVSGGD